MTLTTYFPFVVVGQMRVPYVDLSLSLLGNLRSQVPASVCLFRLVVLLLLLCFLLPVVCFSVGLCYVQICSMFCRSPGAPPSAPPSLRYLAPDVAFKAWEALFTPPLARASSTVPIHQSV